MTTQQEFKQTEIGRIPKEWDVVRLGEIAEVVSGFGFPIKYQGNKDGKYPFIKVNDLNLAPKYISYSENFIDDTILETLKVKICPPNTIIFPKIGMSTYLNKFRILKIWGTFDNNVAGLISKNEIEPEFLFYYLLEKIDLKRLAGQTAAPSIRKSTLEAITIALPPLPEQKKIAEILSTVDKAIEKVDEAIEKTERLKKGLMQELLTGRRNTVDGRQGRREFKQTDTDIGRIPKEWEIKELKEVVDINKESRDPTREFPDKQFFYIDIDSVENGRGIVRNAKAMVGKEAPSRARRLIHYNDVIMSMVRPYLKAFAIVPREYDNQICSTGFAVLTCKEKILPLYLLYTLFSKPVIEQCNKMMVGGQYPALNSSQVEKIKLPLPPLPEQKKIAEILSTVDKRLELLRKRKEKLERVKKGLMDDLLSGRIRVKVG